MVTLDIFTLIGTLSLVGQLTVLALLTYGYMLKRKFKFRKHGLAMAAAVIIHLILISTIMIPSLVLAVIPDYIVPSPLLLTSVVGLIHAIAGSTGLAMGVWLVAAWRFRKDFKGCFNRKKMMDTTFTVWVVALALGVVLYAIFYGPALIG